MREVDLFRERASCGDELAHKIPCLCVDPENCLVMFQTVQGVGQVFSGPDIEMMDDIMDSETKTKLPGSSTTKTGNGRTWLFLINGGEKSFEEEKVARDELKKIYQCFVSNKLVKPEHVVCATGGRGKLFQHETITNVFKVSSVVSPPNVIPTTQSVPPVNRRKKTAGFSGGFQLGNCDQKAQSTTDVKPSTNLTPNDSAIIVFIGHGSDPPSASQIPPSSDKETGRLIFLSREAKPSPPNPCNVVSYGLAMTQVSPCTDSNKRYDDLTDFQLAAGKTLFICQACYSGNVVNKMTKRAAQLAKDKYILAISTGPDHPASYDPILAAAISDFFSSDWKEKTLSDFHDQIQGRYYDFPYYKQMFKENLEQTEEDYEEERSETTDWATEEFEMYQPRQIPQELWKMFQTVEKLKASINHSDDQNKEKLMAHVREMEGYRFDLMRMYKHKPNYKMHMYGSVDVMGKLKMAEFLHLS